MVFNFFFLFAEKYFAAQSLDNQILVYSTDNFRQARNKRFAGHSIAGYACQLGFSPDGKWISSGDGEGNMIFWEWKTGRIKSRLKTHSKVVIAHEWLPHETVSCLHPLSDGVDVNCTFFSLTFAVFFYTVESYHRVVGRPHKTLGEYPFLWVLGAY
jgi:WD40 repeat protein